MGLLVAGTGALACLFATRLVEAGNEVTMLGSWPEGLAALKRRGVRLLEMDGRVKHFPVNVIDGSTNNGVYSTILVLVKSWQTEVKARQLEPRLSPQGIALTLQNGLGNYEILQDKLGSQRAAMGVTTVAARLLEPGYAQFTGVGKVSLGAHFQIEPLAEMLQVAGFVVEIVADLESLLWGKLVINAAINPLTALLRIRNGDLLNRPVARRLLAEVVTEAAAVAAGSGVQLPYPNPVQMVEEVARNTAANYSSMLQDVLRGTPTEIDAINGAIVKAGELVQVVTPVNRIIWQLVKSLEL